MSITRILLVEDEQSLADTIKLNLEMEGYKVQLANDGKKALRMFKQERFDLVILDVMLPEMDGFTVCEAIRLDNEHVPVLFLTAKHSSSDRVTGLKMGADDYLTKPFNLEELLLRIQILLKRTQRNGEKVTTVFSNYSVDNFNIKLSEMSVVTPEQKKINLTKKENTLLKLLIDRKNEVVSREHILETVWGYDIYPSTRTIDNFIVTFRKYFEKDPSNPTHFISVRGVGYKFIE
ncbi:MAG: response regulator transcription factor [Bacteroidetes bacterium]|nr:response regulator transcription factor [Bacteroidota bacterium]